MKKARTLTIAQEPERGAIELSHESRLVFDIGYEGNGYIEVRHVREVMADEIGFREEQANGVTITEVFQGKNPAEGCKQVMTVELERARDIHTLLGRVLAHADAFMAHMDGMVNQAAGKGRPMGVVARQRSEGK